MQWSWTSPLPCLYKDCLCTFKPFNSLQVQLSTRHTEKDSGNIGETAFRCQLCKFVELCTQADLRRHLKLRQAVACPYQDSVTVGVLNVSEDAQQQGPHAVHLQPITAIILEGATVMDSVRDFPQAVCLHSGLCLPFTWITKKHIHLHSSSHAWTGKQNPPSKTDDFAEQTNGVVQLTLLSTNFEGFVE